MFYVFDPDKAEKYARLFLDKDYRENVKK